ncbi:MAG: hypothetical protein WAT39_12475 [Planctomycetota bacterium]
MRNSAPFLLAAALAAATAIAQQPHLIGIGGSASTLVHLQQNACALLATASPAGFPPLIGQPNEGGAAWDPVLSGAWISNGPTIACVDDNGNYLCAPVPSPTPFPITGLECVEHLNELWATDTRGNLARMTRTCPPTFLSLANTGVPWTANSGLSGLAVDEGNGLVFYTESDFITWSTILHVATLANPTVQFFSFNVANWIMPCSLPFRPAHGVAVDWAARRIYLTDGLQTISTYYWLPPNFLFGFGVNCCTLFTPDHLIGLAWRPGGATPFGGPCANGTCTPCPMVHGLVNDSNMGNLGFQLRLTNAQSGGVALCHVSWGSCSSPGWNIPGLCGPLWTTTNTLTTLSALVLGPPGCNGTATFALPLPPIAIFGYPPVSSQCIELCPGGGLNTAMSNCLDWNLQGN